MAVKKATVKRRIRRFKTGDMVKVLRKARTHERGWSNSWVDEYMDKTVGQVGQVIDASKDHPQDVMISFLGPDSEGFGYPAFVLKLVKAKK